MVDRRRFLRAVTGALTVTAGCTSGPDTTGTATPTATTDGTSPTDWSRPTSTTRTRTPDLESEPCEQTPSASTGTATPAPASPDWTQQADAPISASAIDTDAVYLGTANGTVSVHAHSDGTRLWTVEYSSQVRTLISVNGTLLVIHGWVEDGVSDYTVVALDSDDGSELWTADLQPKRLDVHGIREDTIYLASHNHNRRDYGEFFYAVSLTDGSVEWKRETGDSVYSSIGEDGIYLKTGRRVDSIDADSGTVRWSKETRRDDTICSLDRTVVYRPGEPAVELVGADAETGERRFEFDRWRTDTVLAGETAFYVAGDAESTDSHLVGSLRPSDGGVNWATEVRFEGADLHLDDERVYSIGWDGISACNRETGCVDWEWTLPSGYPGIELYGATLGGGADGRLYAESETVSETGEALNYTYAVDAATGEWLWALESESDVSTIAAGEEVAVVGDEHGDLYVFA